MRFKDKVAVVTGAGRGIGKEIARKLCMEGAQVILVTSSEEAHRAREEFVAAGFKADSYQVNIKSGAEVEDLFNKVTETYGAVDILVNNAGITKDALMLRMTEQDWDDVLDVNLKGAFLCIKQASKTMMKKRSGKIINITSVVGVMGNAGQTNYASSKAGLIGLTKSVARELAGRGITCNAIAPGFIETPMTDRLGQNIKESYLNAIPLKRFGTPEEVAGVVAFLASEDANYITGQVLHIDGGLLM